MNTSSNPRAVIGGNNPPEPTAIERAEPYREALRAFLNDFPVIANDEEAREGKSILDRFAAALKAIEEERKTKVAPLNEELKAINAEYHKWHSTSGKPGVWDKLFAELKSRLGAYALAEERKRWEAEERARQEAAEAAEKARLAAEAEAEARAAAEAGVCDVDLDAAMADAHTTSQRALTKMWAAQRAEAQTKVRITGGSGNAMSLRDHEILAVTDWRAAIEEIGLTEGIAAAIITAARGYRTMTDQLPAGIEARYERSL